MLNARQCAGGHVHGEACHGFLDSSSRRDEGTWRHLERRPDMGKYFIAWLLGVPAGLLVLIYVFTHLF